MLLQYTPAVLETTEMSGFVLSVGNDEADRKNGSDDHAAVP